MDYQKPELAPMGKANDVIESGLTKGTYPWDAIQGEPELSNVAAYLADE
jgi:hypothetical protein